MSGRGTLPWAGCPCMFLLSVPRVATLTSLPGPFLGVGFCTEQTCGTFMSPWTLDREESCLVFTKVSRKVGDASDSASLRCHVNPLCAQCPSGALAMPPGSWCKGTDAKMQVIMLSAVPSSSKLFCLWRYSYIFCQYSEPNSLPCSKLVHTKKKQGSRIN